MIAVISRGLALKLTSSTATRPAEPHREVLDLDQRRAVHATPRR